MRENQLGHFSSDQSRDVWITRKIETISRPARLHQLDSIFAIFGAVSGGKPLYFRVWQIENRL